MYSTGNSMNNSLSYCGLIDARISSSENICLYFGLVNARIRASEKELPLIRAKFFKKYIYSFLLFENFVWICQLLRLFYRKQGVFLQGHHS